ncbi:CD2-binding protein-like protein isoform X2 [Tasmannia lanceolata]|uniref:CD2-binding protein-like protein isoform X2 n=1 Tax=Tasmannia lanceolata TaxID=3420 RepID=UPI004063F632
MDEKTSRSNLKRPLSDDEGTHQPPMQKRPRFPKGKKVKKGDEIVGESRNEESLDDLSDPRFAAKERAKRRTQITAELFSEASSGILQDVSGAEVNYEVNDHFEDDGVLIEPFNLKQEREEGYFDADGNFVEYVNEKEIKDAWLDSIDVEARFVERNFGEINKKEEFHDLSSGDIGMIKRRIANVLQPGETVLQALRRLKGTSNDRKEKMPEETKRMFDQLTEDSMKLMENGDYNVYHEEREVFEREAEGYERVARAKEGATRTTGNGTYSAGEDIFSSRVGSSLVSDMASVHSNLNLSTTQISSGDDSSTFDMFGEDDDNIPSNQPANGDNLDSGSNPQPFVQPASENFGSNIELEKSMGGELEADYVYDDSSGYSFNDETGAYDEIKGEAASDPN